MKALVLTRKDEASTPTLTLVRNHPVPTPPPGYLLIRVLASAIHPSDILNAQGNFPYTSYPRIPGRDFAGTVVALGPPLEPDNSSSTTPSSDHDGNGNSLLGATVFGTSGNTHAFTADGFHAEYAVVPAAGVARVPAGINSAAAATLGVPWTTAGMALERARVRAGETVLVLGANGAVGRAAVSLARAMGCSKVMRGVRGAGGDVDTAGDALLGRVGEITGGKGVDVVVDAVGSEALTGAAVKRLGKDGRLVFVAGKGELRIDMREFYRMGKSVVGCNSLNETVESMGGRLRSMVASGSFDLLNGESSESGWEKTSLEGAVEAYSKAAADKKRKFVIMM
ncbi:Zinc-type alcohol dehydrogenase-like protein [Lasiodiplodia hormozganensis]|uniref:Zinc-type alcohol dehydrogenase-like protein n=1 Tax=Lasiodiplodia hormozganensis TaxID=869390 RepID=A0AA39YGA9_9PEZI|nr:Zinc-type alcohol dehydrogenase-like protein [Lasiodiplodia hormozganensis]